MLRWQAWLYKIMNTKTFNQNYELDKTTKRGIRGIPKTVAALPKIEVRTGDGEVYDAAKTYHFFDEGTRQVRQSNGLRQHEVLFLGSFGLRIIEIAKLRNEKDAALSDGQTFLRNRITELNKQIAEFELQKTPKARSLKDYLSAKDAAK